MALRKCLGKAKAFQTLFFSSRLAFVDFLFDLFFAVVGCQSDEYVAASEVIEASDLGIVGDDTQVLGDVALGPAPGVDTVFVFPKNAAKCNTSCGYKPIISDRICVAFYFATVFMTLILLSMQ